MEQVSGKTETSRTRLWIGAVVALAATLFIGANVHLVYVAVTTQPGCVAHETAVEGDGNSFRAAKSAC